MLRNNSGSVMGGGKKSKQRKKGGGGGQPQKAPKPGGASVTESDPLEEVTEDLDELEVDDSGSGGGSQTEVLPQAKSVETTEDAVKSKITGRPSSSI